MSKAKVAILRTSPATVLRDYHTLMNLAGYQEVVEPLRRLAMWGIPIFFGFFSGFAASAQWETTWLWFNGVTTKVTDPQFHLDTGFYLFAMPFYSALLGFISAVL